MQLGQAGAQESLVKATVEERGFESTVGEAIALGLGDALESVSGSRGPSYSDDAPHFSKCGGQSWPGKIHRKFASKPHALRSGFQPGLMFTL